LLLQLGGDLEPLEAIGPEAVEKPLELGQALGARPVQPARPVAPLDKETRFPQHGEVLGDGRSRDVEPSRDLARAQLRVPDELEDLAPVRLGQRSRDRVHNADY